jgi:hypothetical protein
MKKHYLATFTASLGALLLLGGCASQDVRNAKQMVTVDINPGQASKGYVEFYPASTGAIYPIYFVDAQGRQMLLANMGVKAGDNYSYDVHGAPAGERVRVAVPAGTHVFKIDNGPYIHVPVLADKLTPVEVQYDNLDHVLNYVIYRADARPSAPGPFVQQTETKPKK